MATALEDDVLAILRPGGLLTVDTIAQSLKLSPWRVSRALNTLRRNGDAFQNHQSQWQLSAGQQRPGRRGKR